jgi:hypothetical protein
MMKTRLFETSRLMILYTMVSPLVSAGGDRVDLSVRKAIYVTGNKSVIALKSDPFVADGGTKTLTRRQAASCDGDKCTFNLGAIAFRSGGGQVATYGMFSGKFGLVGNSISFGNGENSKQMVLPVDLRVGTNTVKFEVDPYKKTAETDENNNSLTVTIIVE